MPDAQTLDAAKGCIEAFSKLIQALGPGWTFALCLIALVSFIGLYIWRTKESTKAWVAALAAKDQMIEQLNEQNRELRVQALVVGGRFTKEEAAKLVYGDNRLSPSDQTALPRAKK